MLKDLENRIEKLEKPIPIFQPNSCWSVEHRHLGMAEAVLILISAGLKPVGEFWLLDSSIASTAISEDREKYYESVMSAYSLNL